MENLSYVYGRDHLLLAPHLMGYATELEGRDHSADAIPLVVDGIRIYRKARGSEWDAEQTLLMLERFVRRLVIAPGLSGEKYSAASIGGKALASEKSEDITYRNLQGMVAYRLEDHQAAFELLQTPDDFTHKSDDHAVQRLTFLAMVLYKLDRIDESRVRLQEARKLVSQAEGSFDKDTRNLVTEAANLIGQGRLDTGETGMFDP
jgi:hypothetical protein